MATTDELRKVGPSHPEWDARRCGKRLKNGLYCTRFRSRRKDGSRRQYCPQHYNSQINREEKRVIESGYSYVLREELSAKFNYIKNEGKLLDLENELALFRTYLARGVERLNTAEGSKEFELEAEWVFDKVERLTQLILGVVKVRNDTALTVAEIHYLQQGIAKILKKYLPEESLRGAVEELYALTAAEPQTKLRYDEKVEDGIVVQGEDPIAPQFRYIRKFLEGNE